MADGIRSDIEKIERALNIRVEDEVALNAGGSYSRFSFVYGNVSAIPQSIVQQTSDGILLEEHSLLLKFATKLNLSTQRNLFQLYEHCQSIVILLQSISFPNIFFVESFSTKSSINQ